MQNLILLLKALNAAALESFVSLTVIAMACWELCQSMINFKSH